MIQKIGVSAAVIGGCNLAYRYTDSVTGTDYFSAHTNNQHRSHFISGMHEPLIPSNEQKAIFYKHFSAFDNLLPVSLEDFQSRRTISAPVRIRPLKECPDSSAASSPRFNVVVGGPPALISSVDETRLVYINDSRQIPIHIGSAYHLEWDAPSEAPTTFQPITFMAKQVYRVLVPETLKQAEATGMFSWRSLDWIAWIRRPDKWIEGIRLAVDFQFATMSKQAVHDSIARECAERCHANESFFNTLNAVVGQDLLLPEKYGSLIIARNAGAI
jgi:hypothetical protein